MPQALGAKDTGRRSREIGREALKDPAWAKRPHAIVAAAEANEVARVDIHREVRLGREVAIVLVDQIVDFGEVDPLGALGPGRPKAVSVTSIRYRERDPLQPQRLLGGGRQFVDALQPPRP